MLHAKDYQNRLIFHEVIQKKVVPVFLRHDVIRCQRRQQIMRKKHSLVTEMLTDLNRVEK